MSKRDHALYLQDIKESIKKIEKYTKSLTFAAFSRDTEKVDAVVRNLEIIGEAANNIPKKIKDKYPNIPWREIVNARNVIAHEYFGVLLDIIWKTIKDDLPKLKSELKVG